MSVIVRALIGVVFAGVVVWLGLLTAKPHPDPAIIALFGIIAALLGPMAIFLLTESLPSKKGRALEQLAKAGEIEERVAKAETTEQKVKTLEAERRRLTTIIQFETRRQIIAERQAVLLSEVRRLDELAGQMLAELTAIEAESRLLGQEIDNSSVRNEVVAVRKRLQRERTGTVRPYLNWIETFLSAVMPGIGSGGGFSRSADSTLNKIENLRIKRLARRAARASAAGSAQSASDPVQTSGAEPLGDPTRIGNEDVSEETERTG